MGAPADRTSLLLAALRAGGVLGLAKIVVLGVARLAFGVPAVTHVATGLLLWFVTIGILIGAALHLRRATGAFQPYTRALFHLAMTWALGHLLYTGFSILLFHVLEPSLLEATVEPMREIARKSGERAGIAAADIEAVAQGITKETSPFSVGGQLRGYRDGLLPGLVLSALIAIPFRARPDVQRAPQTT
jgi:hypothetical protein